MSIRDSISGIESGRELVLQIFNSIPDEILLVDTDMLVQAANASFLRNNSFTMDEIRGSRCYEVEQHIRGRCAVEVEDCPFFKVMERKVIFSRVRKHLDKDGNVRYAAIVGAPVLDNNGNLDGMIEITQDITHRILLEEELKVTEVRLQQFMEMAPLSAYVKNPKGQYMEVNPGTCDLFCKKANEIIGKADREILPRKAAKVMIAGDQEVLSTRRQVSFDTEVTIGDNKVFLSNVKYPIIDADGRVSAVCGLSTDVTAQKEAEAELTHTREYLENILENSPVMIITTNLQGLVVSFNRGAEELLSYKSDEIIGKPASILYREQVEREDLLSRVIQEGAVRDYQTELVRKDKSTLSVSITLSLLKDSSGSTIGTVGIGKDISHRKTLMDQIIQSERQAAVGRLASGVAHEINNPLAMIGEIAGYLQDLVTGGPGSETADLMEELREGLPKILTHVKKGRSITHRLLSFARKSEAEVEVSDVNAALEEIIPFLEKEAGLAQVKIHQIYQSDLPEVHVEELQLQEIFINLIKNAIQAQDAQRGGNIWLDTKDQNGKIIVTVRDDGPGIAEEVRDRLFDPFVTTKPPGQGTGLGLSICYGIVKRYDGEIRVQSKISEGTTFQVIFPAILQSPGGIPG
ncbi:MAG: PAS domain-containing protein [Proteobacteria bacterium]|nr:PAS domain-containing protein [Pseudomonadota bacterium]